MSENTEGRLAGAGAEPTSTSSSAGRYKLSAAEREQFLTNWLEHMPEVATWTDDEILSGILSGM